MSKIDEQIAAATARLKQLKALAQKQAARDRAAQAKKARSDATRRKIMVGAFVLEQMERNGIGAALLTYEAGRFSDWLTRPDERALFGLVTAPAQVTEVVNDDAGRV
jgi:large subunit ribosomal protein L7/L12